jgi:RNA polymerase subunit RPABC4/transcription elongation factor Spt4
MIICHKCKTLSRDDARFCSGCGVEFVEYNNVQYLFYLVILIFAFAFLLILLKQLVS